MTGSRIGLEIDSNSKGLWDRRESVDYIIICDWGTENLPFGKPIQWVYEAMTMVFYFVCLFEMFIFSI